MLFDAKIFTASAPAFTRSRTAARKRRRVALGDPLVRRDHARAGEHAARHEVAQVLVAARAQALHRRDTRHQREVRVLGGEERGLLGGLAAAGLAMGAAVLVEVVAEVHVGVDPAGQQRQPREVVAPALGGPADRRDLRAAHHHHGVRAAAAKAVEQRAGAQRHGLLLGGGRRRHQQRGHETGQEPHAHLRTHAKLSLARCRASPATPGSSWPTTSPSSCGALWCARPAPARAAAATGRSATARWCRARPAVETLIEFSHRLTSGVALLLVLGLVVGALRAFPPGHAARRWAWASFAFILGEAAVGAGLVLFELVADNKSMARALFMGTHLINTFFLLGALTLTAFHAGRERKEPGRLSPSTAAGLLGMLLVGASGAIAALGDTLFPAGTLAEALRQDLSPTAHLLVRLRTLHPFLSITVGALLVWLAARSLREVGAPESRRPARAVVGLVFAQCLLGVVNVALLAPVVLQIAHLLLADALWIALVLLAASTGQSSEIQNWKEARLAPERVASRNA